MENFFFTFYIKMETSNLGGGKSFLKFVTNINFYAIFFKKNLYDPGFKFSLNECFLSYASFFG